ncbi:MAG: glycosyltransferase family 39 protein [Planctomycetes bacterium]|nr:glycosyltransferase family 39 protein [Planctomycetota bacterium]
MTSGGNSGRGGAAAGIAVVLAAMALAAVVRLRTADTPLERDEGEYAYSGQLILDGVPPYRLACNMKFPGTYYAYAGIMAVFGETPRGIRTGLLLVNAATALLLFAIGRRLLGTVGGAAAAACFSVFSLDLWIMGLFAHATHFVLLPVLAGVYLLLRDEGRPRPATVLAAGACLGLGVLMKQHGAAYLLLGAALLLRRGRRGAPASIALLAAGAALPAALLVAVLAAAGVLDRFWFWTFRYAAEYVTQRSPSEALGILFETARTATAKSLPFWFAAAAGLVLSLATRPVRPGGRFTPAALLAASLLAICPGFHFREHYYILLLPAAALLVGAAAATVDRFAARLLPRRVAWLPAATGLLVLLCAFLAGERETLFERSPRELSRLRYGSSPFIEMEVIGRVLRERTNPGDRIVVLGSEPETLFHADRRSATVYLYMYPLMEDQPYALEMQEEMIAEVGAARPEYAIEVATPCSWGVGPDSERTLLVWTRAFLRRHYELIGVADILSPTETRFAWDAEVLRYRPRSHWFVNVFRRK